MKYWYFGVRFDVLRLVDLQIFIRNSLYYLMILLYKYIVWCRDISDYQRGRAEMKDWYLSSDIFQIILSYHDCNF
jgi:hypothetical protein